MMDLSVNDLFYVKTIQLIQKITNTKQQARISLFIFVKKYHI